MAFHRLGAVIADEQHRFGVAQRAALSAKGETPHVLVMSATPIPRTLALILYGDGRIRAGRVAARPQSGRDLRGGRKYAPAHHRLIDKQIAAGGQAYVVCPLVEEGELNLKSAEQHAKDLQAALPHRRVAVLHGRMKNADKEQVMRDFAARQYDIWSPRP